MKSLLVCVVVAAVALSVLAGSGMSGEKKAKKPPLGKLRHIVLFQFKEGTAPEKVKEIEDAFGKLPSKIPTVVDFEWGTNNSPEGLADGFTHCFLVTFNDDAGRQVYLPHPAHKEFVGILKPHLEKVLVIDYVAKD
ncbi:MAG TPA: Dabb family protein [Thermoguttaceae bacterium]|nr:Dabb family protein [Thermoguttaceae bacterium]